MPDLLNRGNSRGAMLLFYLGHPAHFHLFRNTINELSVSGNNCMVLVKRKDVLMDLVAREGWDYLQVANERKGNGRLASGWSLLRRDLDLWRFAKRERPRLMIGTSAEIGHVGRMLGIPSIVVNEDDAEAVPLFTKLAYPFADHIVVPECCSLDKWKEKAVRYNGFHELAYLHPDRFTPTWRVMLDLAGASGRYFILRFAELSAHHDTGKTGIGDVLARRLVNFLAPNGTVYVTSERPMSSELERFRFPLSPDRMHDALAFADLYIGDSQTMAAEAAVLGTPSIRFNDFVGRLGYLEELEHKYGLTYGIKTSAPEALFAKIDELLAMPDLRQEWQRRRKRMLADKIDVTALLVWFIENYPESAKTSKLTMVHRISSERMLQSRVTLVEDRAARGIATRTIGNRSDSL
ncbi:MAG TPA: DUF354 domain-containing protein [Rhodothermales bacterium]|nr:DUF354 domain-containing protein [Rhodothermales bacterium]